MIRLKPVLLILEYGRDATDHDFAAKLPEIYETLSYIPRDSWRLETVQVANTYSARVYLYAKPSVMMLLKMKHGHKYAIS